MIAFESIAQLIAPTLSSAAYKSQTYNLISRLFSLLFDQEYGEHGSCNQLTVKSSNVYLPYFKMGNLDSRCLFGLDELIIFLLYDQLSDSISSALDIGANIGLHSTILSHLGFSVTAVEPDPQTFLELSRNLTLNKIDDRVITHNAAVSNHFGSATFTRVCDNLMGSHITGSKSSVYGPTETFDVPTIQASHIFLDQQLVKIDAEGHEFSILEDALSNCSNRPEIILEVGSETNKTHLYDLLIASGYNIITQKNSWNIISQPSMIPSTHNDGSMICTTGLLLEIINSLTNHK